MKKKEFRVLEEEPSFSAFDVKVIWEEPIKVCLQSFSETPDYLKLLQQFLQFVVQVFAPQSLGQDDSISVDEEVHGDAHDTVHGSGY